MKKTVVFLLLFACLASLLCGCGRKPAAPEIDPDCLDVYCFSAGAADAFLLMTGAGTVLIDTGEAPLGEEILSLLAQEGITSLDCLILTHFDQDHVGGAADVLKGIKVRRVLESNCPRDDASYKKYVKALKKKKITAETVRQTLTFTVDDVTYTVEPPAQETYAVEPSNNSSLIVTVQYGESRLLFLGDAEDARMTEYLSGSPQTCGFLKVPHHGRYHAVLTDVLDAVQPAAAVITSSEEEPEENGTIRQLAAVNAETFLTRIAPVLVKCDVYGAMEVSYVR